MTEAAPAGQRAPGLQEKEKPAPFIVVWPGPAGVSLVSGSNLPVYHTPGPGEQLVDPAGRVQAGCGVSWNSAVTFLRSYKDLSHFEAATAQQPLTQGPTWRPCLEGQLCLTALRDGVHPSLHVPLSVPILGACPLSVRFGGQ